MKQEKINYGKPETDISENKKDDQWYRQFTRYYLTFYNKKKSNDFLVGDDLANGNDIPATLLTPIEKGLKYSLYYLGQQQNINYKHTTTDFSGNNLQAVWTKGKKIRQLVDHLLGNLLGFFDNKEVSVVSLSPDVMNKKRQLFEELMLKYDTRNLNLLKELAKLGISYDPVTDKTFQDIEDVERYINHDLKEDSEKYAALMAQYIEQYNDDTTKYIQAALDFISANFCGIYPYVENNKIKHHRIPFYNLIIDDNDDDPYNRKARFCGFIERLTPDEIFTKWKKIKPEDKAELKRLAEGKNDAQGQLPSPQFYNMDNLKMWGSRNGEPQITTVTMFWKSQRDFRYQDVMDKFGNTHTKKINEKKGENETGDYIGQDWHYCILSGNNIVLERGYADNIIRTKENMADPEPPIKILNGNTFLRDGLSMIGLVSDNADRMDYFHSKIIEKTGKDNGKTYVFDGSKLPEGVSSKEIINDLKTYGIYVSNVTGEAEDAENNNRPILKQEADFTLDQNIIRYVELLREEERIMEEAMSIPKLAQGSQPTYTGLGVQRGTIRQSALALANFYGHFMKWNEIVLNYSVNVAKKIWADKKDFPANMVVGDRGFYHLNITKDFSYGDLLCFITVKDIIDETAKQRLIAIGQAMAQNQQIDMLDYLKVEMATSKTELYNELEFSLKKRKREMMMAQMANEAKIAAEAQAERQNKAEIAAVKSISSEAVAETNANANALGHFLKADAAEEKNKQLAKV